MPTAVAIQWVDETTPNVPSISGRVVKGFGLILPAMRSKFLVRGHHSTAAAACVPRASHARAGRRRACDASPPLVVRNVQPDNNREQKRRDGEDSMLGGAHTRQRL